MLKPDQKGAIEPSLALAFEDAIMFGRHEELAALLEDIDEDDFPEELRRDLESLRYFREHYGRMKKLSPIDKKKVALMDSSWGMELLNRLRTHDTSASQRRA